MELVCVAADKRLECAAGELEIFKMSRDTILWAIGSAVVLAILAFDRAPETVPANTACAARYMTPIDTFDAISWCVGRDGVARRIDE